MTTQTRFTLSESDLPTPVLQHRCRFARSAYTSIESGHPGTSNARFPFSFISDEYHTTRDQF